LIYFTVFYGKDSVQLRKGDSGAMANDNVEKEKTKRKKKERNNFWFAIEVYIYNSRW
jgi:hypothetical protein